MLAIFVSKPMCDQLFTLTFVIALSPVFNPVKETPEPYTLDLVVEYSRFSQSQSPQQQQTPVKGTPSPSPSHPNTNGSTASNTGNSSGSDRFNCAPCKKSFGSEATWNSHQKSAKHIAAVKDAEKKTKGGRGGGGGGGSNQQKSNSSNNRSKQQETEPEHPEVAEALMSFRKVEKIVKENPGMAASVMWKIAKGNLKQLWIFVIQYIFACEGRDAKTDNPLSHFSAVVTQIYPGDSQSPHTAGPDSHQFAVIHFTSSTSTGNTVAHTDQHDPVSLQTRACPPCSLPITFPGLPALPRRDSWPLADQPCRLSADVRDGEHVIRHSAIGPLHALPQPPQQNREVDATTHRHTLSNHNSSSNTCKKARSQPQAIDSPCGELELIGPGFWSNNWISVGIVRIWIVNTRPDTCRDRDCAECYGGRSSPGQFGLGDRADGPAEDDTRVPATGDEVRGGGMFAPCGANFPDTQG